MKILLAILKNPVTYVLGFLISGAFLCVAGIWVLAGIGFALLAAGAFLIAAALFITRGMGSHTSGGMTGNG